MSPPSLDRLLLRCHIPVGAHGGRAALKLRAPGPSACGPWAPALWVTPGQVLALPSPSHQLVSTRGGYCPHSPHQAGSSELQVLSPPPLGRLGGGPQSFWLRFILRTALDMSKHRLLLFLWVPHLPLPPNPHSPVADSQEEQSLEHCWSFFGIRAPGGGKLGFLPQSLDLVSQGTWRNLGRASGIDASRCPCRPEMLARLGQCMVWSQGSPHASHSFLLLPGQGRSSRWGC